MRHSVQLRKWELAIRKSGRFDRDFYRRWYGDNREARWSPLRHYVRIGEAIGYWPCPAFCPEAYLEANPDVAEAGVSPFYHYLTCGEVEGRHLRPVPLLWERTAGDLDFPQISPRDPAIRTARFAIVLHIFHYEMWPEFAERVRSLPEVSDFYVTITKRPNRGLEELIAEIREEFPRAFIFPHPNHGRDIFPFLRLVNAGLLADYTAVCKLHTKKSPHLETGKAWSDHLADSLLPGPGDSLKLAEAFLAADDCGVMTADGQRKSGARWWHDNRGRSLSLLACAGIDADPERLCFPAGSMYWLKPPVVEALRNLRLAAVDFDPEFGQSDGTTAHAVERILGYLTEQEELKVSEISEIAGNPLSEEDREFFEFCEPDKSHLGVDSETFEAGPQRAWLPPVSRHVRYEGAIDFCSLRGVVGWIREVSDREVACRLRLDIDGVTVTEGFADQHRADLGKFEDRGSRCGFALPLPDQIFNGEFHGIRITVIGDAWHWKSLSIQTRFPSQSEIGEVTEISNGGIVGWCQDPYEPDFQQEVDLLINGYFTGGTKPGHRGEKERGREFCLEIPRSFRDGGEHELKVVVRGSRICLWEGTERLAP